MRYRNVTLLAALALIVGLTAPAYAATSAMAVVSQADILNVHNKERAAVGVASLQWSSSLQGSAQKWAEHLAAIHKLQHSGPGENIWSGTKGRFSDTQKVGLWTAEKKYFLPGKKFPNVSSTGNWQDVGHYTQVIWYNTKTVGCGQASDASADYLVCQYRPPGNVSGQYPLGHA